MLNHSALVWRVVSVAPAAAQGPESAVVRVSLVFLEREKGVAIEEAAVIIRTIAENGWFTRNFLNRIKNCLLICIYECNLHAGLG